MPSGWPMHRSRTANACLAALGVTLLATTVGCTHPAHKEAARDFRGLRGLDLELRYAVYFEDVERIKCLLEAGADVNARRFPDACAPRSSTAMQDTLPSAESGADLEAWRSGESGDYGCPVIVNEKMLVGYTADTESRLDARVIHDMTVLHDAAAYNARPEIIRTLLAAGADPAAADSNGDTPLHHAVDGDAARAVVALLAAGVEVDPRNDLGSTPLSVAVALHRDAEFVGSPHYPGIVFALLAASADPNATDNHCRTPLHRVFVRGGRDGAVGPVLRTHEPLSIREDSVSLVAALLKAGADANTPDCQGVTPLHHAAYINPNMSVLRMLLDAGANVSARDDCGATPLHWAAAAPIQYRTAIDTLIEAGAQVDARTTYECDDATPLHWAAAEAANPAIIEALLDAGANVDELRSDEQTPLMLAAEYNTNVAVTTALLKAGAEVEVHDVKHLGMSPLMLAAWSNANPAVVEALLAAGEDLRAEENRSALHTAAVSNANPAVAGALLEAGADIHAMEDGGYGFMPVHSAASNRNPAMITMLLTAGAGLEHRTRWGQTPLTIAASYGNLAVVETLVELGADVNARDDDGRTPLHYAFANALRHDSSSDIIALLLESGADPALRDSDGLTAQELAEAE